ncbi:putative neuronal acetylcholine receptor subunit alpha-7 [Teladorsagia circumcincta]|uniref:Putative neuronal acetylcholine receptor subunit alpha-7 n=1 Tax=Teladorsagia circumcincta TaxID=45464 RepID=A0A2G9UGT1_TELCI|nr:putative neuronal acetylcholine receptor subunit alpha-7 [Teladorsagia circumcincta]
MSFSDEKNQVITLVLWTQYTWNDYKMHWDPNEYGNITNIQLPHDFLWKPDILLFNSADEHFDASFPVNFVVSSNGDVLLAPPGIVKVSCELSMTWFPFDEQMCFIKYGSWTYTGSKLDLHIDDSGLSERHKMDLMYYVPNGEFELLATPADRIASEFNGERYVELFFRVHLKRKTLYYGLNWIIPSILISISNVLGFTMPPECGEKITLQITNLLSVTVFLGMVSEITPPTSESIPIIAVFFSLSMLLLGCSIIATLVIINVHFRSPRTHQMGKWIQLIFLEWLPWFLLMSRPGKKFTRRRQKGAPENGDEPFRKSAGKHVVLIDDEQNGRFLNGGIPGLEKVKALRPHLIRRTESFAVDDSIEMGIREIIALLNAFKERLDEEDRDSDLQADWKFMAMVIDRFSLFLFTVLIVATTSLIFLSTPRLFVKSPVY